MTDYAYDPVLRPLGYLGANLRVMSNMYLLDYGKILASKQRRFRIRRERAARIRRRGWA